ncbi:MBOAT family O-acyltransferase [Cytophaga aurantiaca]|uniref:MBOAT family O-acyltransferase n=1 Tax=Cytophaga aurantiaca TaxID=29530 RepID=UPI00037D84BD|nr:MBOAT family O-acyltransferase [Cytophaga aurantiaca]
MLFNSIPFAFFLILFFIGYWFVFNKNIRLQNAFVFVSSYVFYGWWDWRFLFLISFSSLLGFGIGWWMDSTPEERIRKRLLTLSIVINVLFLAAFKYLNFFIDSTETLIHKLGFEADFITLHWILPIGISFYTFHNISYIVDVYRKHIQATKDPIVYLSFMSYFPQLVAGPIQRAKDLIPQFQHVRIFNYAQATAGLQQLLWGLFKKVVIADTCAHYANNAFAHYEALSGLQLLLGVVFFAFQIYGDFSGYTDMALGISKLFGIELTTNFKTPYFARSIPDFWRRWHISLTTWFKDYVYIPLGGNKKGMAVTLRNTFIIFLVSGFWHGANWTFIVWGLLNAIYFIPYLFLKMDSKEKNYSVTDYLQMFLVFVAICFAWIFFRAASLTEAMAYIKHLFGNSFITTSYLTVFPISILLPLIFLLNIEWIYFRKDGFKPIHFPSQWIAWPVYICLAFIILMNMSFHKNSDFIYFQF